MSVEAMSDADLEFLVKALVWGKNYHLNDDEQTALDAVTRLFKDVCAARLDVAERESDELRAAQGWRTIDSAPRDAMIIGYADEMIRLVMWEGGKWVQVGATIQSGWFEPTHWQPLPSPPTR